MRWLCYDEYHLILIPDSNCVCYIQNEYWFCAEMCGQLIYYFDFWTAKNFSPKYKRNAIRQIMIPYMVVMDDILSPLMSNSGDIIPACSIIEKAL